MSRAGSARSFSRNSQGILLDSRPPVHRNDEYDAAAFEMLLEMQEQHFWYLGRHRFLLRALLDAWSPRRQDSPARAIDYGGGCGGWVKYLARHAPQFCGELGLADSSLDALELAAPVVGPDVNRYQVDLLDLPWENHWDVAFLLDVLEHIPADTDVMGQIRKTLRPGGLLLVTTPALQFFWSDSDELAQHVRRYSRRDFSELAERTGFELCRSRYFMFFLSPLVLASRRLRRRRPSLSREERLDVQRQMLKTPRMPINGLLRLIFAAETPLGLRVPFPWGTSVLGVFRKPD